MQRRSCFARFLAYMQLLHQTYKRNEKLLSDSRMRRHNGHAHEYLPRHIAIARQGGSKVFELLIKGDDRTGALARLSGILAGHKVDIRNVYSHADKKKDSFVVVLYMDMAKANLSIEQLVSELKKRDSVKYVEFVRMENRVYDQFLYPIYILGEHRAAIARIDALIKIEERLTKTYGTGGAAIMFEEGKTFAREGFRMIKEALPKLNGQLTVENMRDGFRAQGWGLFEIKETRDGSEVKIENPPILKGSGVQASRLLLGMCAGAVEEAFGYYVTIANSSYDWASDTLSVSFRKTAEKKEGKPLLQSSQRS